MREKTFSLRFLTTVGLIISCLLVINVFGNKNKAEQLGFNLEKISVFDIDEQIVGRFIRGHVSCCEEQPQADVGTYPAASMIAEVAIEDHARLYLGNRD